MKTCNARGCRVGQDVHLDAAAAAPFRGGRGRLGDGRVQTPLGRIHRPALARPGQDGAQL